MTRRGRCRRLEKDMVEERYDRSGNWLTCPLIGRPCSACKTTSAASVIVLFNRPIIVPSTMLFSPPNSLKPMHATYRLQIVYRPATFQRCISLWRTVRVGAEQRTIRRFHGQDQVRPRLGLPRHDDQMTVPHTRPGRLPLTRLLLMLGATPDDTWTLRRLQHAQVHSVLGCAKYRKEHVYNCMVLLAQLKPPLPIMIWHHMIWAML